MQLNPVLWRRILAVTGLLAILLAGHAAPASANGADPGVLPPPARPYGSTYAEWSARWWQWALAIPAASNPLNDGSDCLHVAEGQSGPVWFLGGAIDKSANLERNCSVPVDKALFFPVINVECSTLEAPPFYGADGDALRTCVDGFTLADAYCRNRWRRSSGRRALLRSVACVRLHLAARQRTGPARGDGVIGFERHLPAAAAIVRRRARGPFWRHLSGLRRHTCYHLPPQRW